MKRIGHIQPIKQVYKGKHCKQKHHENFAEIFAKEKNKSHGKKLLL